MPDPAPVFIRALAQLENSRQRAALAALRRSLQDGRSLDAAPYVLPFGIGASDESSAFVLAGLFSLHPEVGSASIAEALRVVKVRKKSESVELRFRALLSASRTELPVHLRHAISLAASESISVNWANLYWALRMWDTEPNNFDGRHPRRQWARDFWAEDVQPLTNDSNS
jgi:CRISPR type I-E-associated protein CasB/Cse2